MRPHPHIGLATVTYLFEGEILHRDSLGTVQTIRAGEVNWMTAGRGIVHSERTPPGLRGIESRLFGIQIWVALPVAHEEDAPAFAHHENLPLFQENGVSVRLILGDLFGMSSPVATISPMFYADVSLAAGKSIAIPSDPDERAVYVVEGAIEIGAQIHGEGELLVLQMGADVRLRAALGGLSLIKRRIGFSRTWQADECNANRSFKRTALRAAAQLRVSPKRKGRLSCHGAISGWRSVR